MKKPFILVLCTGNSCRSQMAEAVLKRELGELADVASAGSAPTGQVHPLAVRVLAEIGLDAAHARSKHLSEFLNAGVTTVITVCGNAQSACPTFPGKVRRHHFGFDDPAHCAGDEAFVLAEFRRVRDEIEKVFTAYAAGVKDTLA